MPSLDSALLGWAVRVAAPGADVIDVRGLRDGGSPWLVRLSRRGAPRTVVLRVGSGQDPSALRTEVAALQFAAKHDIPAPRLLAAELAGDAPAVLVELLAGSSAIPSDRPTARLRTLGRTAAALHAVAVEPGPVLPRRDRPIASEDFAALRRQQPARPLLMEAEERVTQLRSREADVFVHGDLWQGNALWNGDTLAGLVDWDCAGAGPPGVDLGSLRHDAAICFDIEAADDVQHGKGGGRRFESVRGLCKSAARRRFLVQVYLLFVERAVSMEPFMELSRFRQAPSRGLRTIRGRQTGEPPGGQGSDWLSSNTSPNHSSGTRLPAWRRSACSTAGCAGGGSAYRTVSVARVRAARSYHS